MVRRGFVGVVGVVGVAGGAGDVEVVGVVGAVGGANVNKKGFLVTKLSNFFAPQGVSGSAMHGAKIRQRM